MKYPFVLFFRLDQYSEIDAQMKDSDLLNCSVNIINNSTELNKLFDFGDVMTDLFTYRSQTRTYLFFYFGPLVDSNICHNI
jgi:hypothetical protein